MALRGTLNNPKNLALARKLRLPPGVTLGILETIWEWTGTYRRNGAISESDLDSALDFGRLLSMVDTQVVLSFMLDPESRFLDPLPDGKYFIHDWHEHADPAVQRSMARAKQRFANGSEPKLAQLGKAERDQIEAWYRANPYRPPTIQPVGPSTGQPTIPTVDSPQEVQGAYGGATLGREEKRREEKRREKEGGVYNSQTLGPGARLSSAEGASFPSEISEGGEPEGKNSGASEPSREPETEAKPGQARRGRKPKVTEQTGLDGSRTRTRRSGNVSVSVADLVGSGHEPGRRGAKVREPDVAKELERQKRALRGEA